MTLSLKEQKEAFVTGHGGTTPLENFLVCLISPVGIFVFNELRHVLLSEREDGDPGPKRRTHAVLVAVESSVILFPMAICQTSLLYPLGISLIILESVLGVLLFCRRMRASTTRASSGISKIHSREHEEAESKWKFHFLTAYRSSVSYLTFVAILAVDFRIFPRRFAKTETIGYGFMDLGAGSFIVAGGLVSSNARSIGISKQHGKEGALITSAMTRTAPLILLGFVRLITNKGIEYQEHASEYGTHWNFFFTLALVSLLAPLMRFDRLAGAKNQIILPALLMLAYQVALSCYGLQDYIESAPRHCLERNQFLCDFFASNREGLVGSVGYLAMFLIAEVIGNCCLWNCKREEARQRGMRLLLCSLVLWIIHFILVDVCDIPVSRRSTNSSFITWTLAHNVSLLFLIWLAFHSAEFRATTAQPSPILDAVNRHGLIVFVLANLMTGLVNITINTLESGDTVALFIIFGYLFSVGIVALFLDCILPSKEKKHKLS